MTEATFQLCRECFDFRPSSLNQAVRPDAGEMTHGESSEKPQPSPCPRCHSPRILQHPELDRLSIAHIDCDAFYASVEKRDDPELRDKPVVIGGGRRGVVSAACYVARIYGVRSAMPMFKALKACPDAVVIRPDMAKYSRVGKEIRQLMLEATPQVEPISIDEAFLDLNGTERLHGAPPSVTLARLVRRIETEIGVTASIGLSYNKFLAKLSSDLDKPRGFAVIGEAEAVNLLAPMSVSKIWGVGKALNSRLAADGVRVIGDLQRLDEITLAKRYGSMGSRLFRFARGQDNRTVSPESETKSISAETTFLEDHTDVRTLEHELWPLCETVSRRLKKQEFSGRTVTLKLRTADFKIVTRSRTLNAPTQLAEVLYRVGTELLEPEADGRAYRLIGIGASELTDPRDADPFDLGDPDASKRADLERAVDAVRDKLGRDALAKGRGWSGGKAPKPD